MTTSINFREIPFAEISPSPKNPRKNFAGAKFDELVASIKEKGVLEPIIVRPLKGFPSTHVKTPFEIVAGERRFRAVVQLAQDDGAVTTIPAIIRELTDEQAFEFMIIENLQRDDLTEREEAESFKAYVGRHGQEAIRVLAEKTGIRPAYIRARVAVLGLAKPILTAWEKGEIRYAHLEQLLRLPGPTEQKKAFDEINDQQMTAVELKAEINRRQISLSCARFDLGDCANCRNNSTVQQDLFGLGNEKAVCQHPECFKKKQGAWLTAHWLETEFARKDKTRGFRFVDELEWGRGRGQKHEFYDKPARKCFECENFVTMLEVTGQRPKYGDHLSCVGDLKCSQKARAAGRAEGQAETRSEKKKAAAAGNAPRVSWHGEYFRDVFNRKAIDVLIPKISNDVVAKKLAVLAIARGKSDAASAVGRALGVKFHKGSWQTEGWIEFADLVAPILKSKPTDVENLLRTAIRAVVNEGEIKDGAYDTGRFGTENRDAVALFLGADLAREFSVDDEYLQKKTKAEIISFGKKSGIFKDPKVQKKLGGKEPEKLKKSELVDVILKSDVNLVGKVPDEVLKGRK